MVNISSIEGIESLIDKGIESLIDKRTKPLKEEILKLRFELEELKQALTIPVVSTTVNCEHVRGSVVSSDGVWYKECKKCGELY